MWVGSHVCIKAVIVRGSPSVVPGPPISTSVWEFIKNAHVLSPCPDLVSKNLLERAW